MKRGKVIAVLAVLGALAVAVVLSVRITITGSYEGIYLLKGIEGRFLELKDDLFLNEGARYIIGVDLDVVKRFVRGWLGTSVRKEPSLSYVWNMKRGDGYVRNHLSGGKQLLTCFSRFVDEGGKEVFGLFVGGGLPANVRGADMTKMNETGMAYFDGERWYHIWCNVNEALFSLNRFEPIAPSAWKFLGSTVLQHNDDDLMLESDHEAVIDGVLLRINRYAAFRAGEPYFLLSVYITNAGNRPVSYSYLYGDEPWLGNYGTSRGNVGWAEDGLHGHVGLLDAHYAGFFDYGNEAAGEGHQYTGVANFLEWFGSERPRVYFSNGPYDNPNTGGKKVPLAGNTRFIGILWGQRTLQPDETAVYTLAIGMAGQDPRNGFPVKPRIDLKYFP
jgi:hypothetical protein